jgi:hypothetical protein
MSGYTPHRDTEREWLALAREAGLHLPVKATPLTTGGMEAWLRKLGLTVAQYCQWDASRTLKDFARLNPTWGLRSWAGLVLENRARIKGG